MARSDDTPPQGHLAWPVVFANDLAADLGKTGVDMTPERLAMVRSWMLAAVRSTREAELKENERLLRELEVLEGRYEGVVRDLITTRDALRAER